MNAQAKHYESAGDRLTGEEQERAYRAAQSQIDVTKDKADWSRLQAKIIKNLRTRAAAAGLESRWGERRSPSRTIRVDADVATDLQKIPERDRRAFASNAIRTALKP